MTFVEQKLWGPVTTLQRQSFSGLGWRSSSQNCLWTAFKNSWTLVSYICRSRTAGLDEHCETLLWTDAALYEDANTDGAADFFNAGM